MYLTAYGPPQLLWGYSLTKTVKTMKLLTVFLFAGLLQAHAKGYAQQISITAKDLSIEQVFKSIEKQTSYVFFYDQDALQQAKQVTLDVKAVSLKEALDACFKGQPLNYNIVGKTIVVAKKLQPATPGTATNKAPLVLPPIDIVGTVKDSSGNPLAGATVALKGTTTATKTDANGNFSLTIPSQGGILLVSFTGYNTTEVEVAKSGVVNITLYLKNSSNEEIVVVAYGKQKKISVTGSQVTVKPEELKLPVRDLTNALAGRLAGVTAVQRSGEPGVDGSEIYIRGVSTISGTKGPLMVVDGVPGRGINDIDPEDIESFTILKDAGSTAVYGAEGANGVIIISTKKGRAGKPLINVEYNEARNKFTQLPKFVGAVDFIKLYNEANIMRGGTQQIPDSIIAKYANHVDPDVYPDVNWFDELFNKYGQNRRLNLNIRGGADVASYYISAGYYNESGLYKWNSAEDYKSANKLDRFNFATNVTVKATKTTTLELGVSGYITNATYPAYRGNTLFASAFNAPPHRVPARYSNGQWPEENGVNQGNPYMYLIYGGYQTYYDNTTRSNLTLNQNLDFITKGLSFKAVGSFDAYSSTSLVRSRIPTRYFVTDANHPRDSAGNLITSVTRTGTDVLGFSSGRGTTRNLYTQAGLDYNRSFGDHTVTGVFLFNQSDYIDGDATDLISSINYRKRGIVGRASYGFKDKYFVEGSFGYTGSENFAPANRYGFFPSGGVGWIISKEKFFAGLSNVINYFKVRYSYGLAGLSNVVDPNNIAGTRFLYLDRVVDGNGYTFGVPGNTTGGSGGYNEGLVANTTLQWETSKRHNLGVEINTWHNAVQLVVELFKERREDILVRNYTVPYISGYTTSNLPFANIGVVENKGIDVTLTVNKQFRHQSFVSFTGTFTYNRNKVINNGLPPRLYSWTDPLGQPVGQRFGLLALGLFKDSAEILASPKQTGDVRPGDIKYADMNGDGVISPDKDNIPLGYGSIPRIMYGLNFGFGYRGFDLGLFFQGAGQVDFMYIPDPTSANADAGTGVVPFARGYTYGNQYATMLDRWTPDNDGKGGSNNGQPFYPRMSIGGTTTSNYYMSSWWLKRADYIRLKSAELGYNFDIKGLEKYSVNKMRLYVSGTNLWTLSKWKIWDPELGDGKGGTYPNTTTYNVGFRITFK